MTGDDRRSTLGAGSTDEGGDSANNDEKSDDTEEFPVEPEELDWRDYIAISIGLLRTVLLPFVIAFLVLLALTLFAMFYL